MHPRTVILGGTGFIGSHLAEELIKSKYPVTLLARDSRRLSTLPPLVQSEANFIAGDYRDSWVVSGALDGCDLAIHAISSTDPGLGNMNPAMDVENNLVSMIRFLEQVKAHRVKHVMFLSSGGTVYGRTPSPPVTEDAPTNPICSYGIVKLAMEKYLHMYSETSGVSSTIVRLANPYGERQSPEKGQGIVSVLLDRVAKNLPVQIYGRGEVIRDFIYVEDAVKAMHALLEGIWTRPSCSVFNVGTGIGTSIREVLEYVGAATGKAIRVEYLEGRPVDVPVNVLSILKLIKTTGWMPSYSVYDGICKTWRAIRDGQNICSGAATLPHD
jgi:UDP-glucose 4-epimerase